MRTLFIVCLVSMMSFASPAQTEDPTPPEAPTLKQDPRFFGLLMYSPLDLVIPGKLGLSGGWISEPGYQNEIEYLRGSLSVPFLVKDLGSMTEERFSYIRRRFYGDHGWNFSYGFSYFKTTVHIGDSLMNTVTGGNYPSADLVDIQSLGAHLGIGNRWLIRKHWILSIDWLSWHQPILSLKKSAVFLDATKDSSAHDDVSRAVNVFANFPRLTVLKLQVGYEF